MHDGGKIDETIPKKPLANAAKGTNQDDPGRVQAQVTRKYEAAKAAF
jgi:hypothetical protein